jgi:16S rRNA (guanine966-N2)-methyltransferase
VRIIAGRLGGRRIRVPEAGEVRPTPERVREALFSILADRLLGASVLDLYAGSGALGLEAISRGADRVVSVESDRRVEAVLRANVEALGVGASVRVLRADVRTAVERLLGSQSFDLVLADPPYASDETALLEGLVACSRLEPGGWVVVERPTRGAAPSPPPGLEHLRSAVYGDSRLDFYGDGTA